MFGSFSRSFTFGKRGTTTPYTTIMPDLTGTEYVPWTEGSWFYFNTETITSATSILASNQNITYQLCYAHQALALPSDSVARLGVGTYSTQVSSPKNFVINLGTANNVQKFAYSSSLITSDSYSSAANTFVSTPLIASFSVTIPANRWFLLGFRTIAFAATKPQTTPRTMGTAGTPYMTVYPTVYRAASLSDYRTPSIFGGVHTLNAIYTGYAHPIGVKFRLYEGKGSAVTVVAQSPFSGGGNSYNFSNSTDSYVYRAASADWALGAADFTIEWFSYQTDTTDFQRVFTVGDYSGAKSPIEIGVSIENGTFLFWKEGSATNVGSAGNLNTWVHWAVVRRTSSTKIYRNGQQFGSNIVDPTNYDNYTQDLYIGNTNTPDIVSAFRGYITNFRWIKGQGIYTANFTVPTSALTADSPANPYGGSNTSATAANVTKLLLIP